MKISRLLLLLSAVSLPLWAADGPPQGRRPPPFDTSTCSGKAAGETVQTTGRDGRSVSGTCQLVFVPDRPSGPPPSPDNSSD